jgi:hypothetical protein
MHGHGTVRWHGAHAPAGSAGGRPGKQAPRRRRSSAASQPQQLGAFGRGRRGVAFGAWRSSLVMATTPPTPGQHQASPLRFYTRAGTDKSKQLASSTLAAGASLVCIPAAETSCRDAVYPFVAIPFRSIIRNSVKRIEIELQPAGATLRAFAMRCELTVFRNSVSLSSGCSSSTHLQRRDNEFKRTVRN